MAFLEIRNLGLSFDGKPVLENINLDIKEGEMVSLLGASGCGKSTTLKTVAGILKQDVGDIFIDGENVNNIKTGQRGAVIVFQDYLLFPHMTVIQNIEFGMKMMKVDKSARKEKAMKLLETVKLSGYENRYPNELSGGQQQRVSIARALAVNPKVLLLDEPFSNLDVNLRSEMRKFVSDLQKELKITTILVTHDMEEAILMSDRIAVMIDGRIRQFDEPKKLYEKPVCREVADVFGEKNYISGYINNNIFTSYINDKISFDVSELDVQYDDSENVEIMIPKESINIIDEDSYIELNSECDNEFFRGIIVDKKYAGENTFYEVDSGGCILKVSQGSDRYNINDSVYFYIDKNRICIFEN